MGYTTDFTGHFDITPPLKDANRIFLTKLAETRRMKRNVGPEYGVEGEFYVDGGQDHDATVIDSNNPPRTQPGLWLQWIPSEDGTKLAWDGGEKFYEYVEWLEYLIAKILAPRGYTLNGNVEWFGESHSDQGRISVKDNVVRTQTATISYADDGEGDDD